MGDHRNGGHAWLGLDGIVSDLALLHDMFKRLDENFVAIHVFDERAVSMLRTACHEIIGLRTH